MGLEVTTDVSDFLTLSARQCAMGRLGVITLGTIGALVFGLASLQTYLIQAASREDRMRCAHEPVRLIVQYDYMRCLALKDDGDITGSIQRPASRTAQTLMR